MKNFQEMVRTIMIIAIVNLLTLALVVLKAFETFSKLAG